jgi:poly(3-hydroxybutyrate) depolymerase/prenyltransferase beta subunit
MKRLFPCLAACLIVVAASARAESPSDLARTSAYIAAFQNPDGGFAAKPGGPSTLGATSQSIRILKNTAGSIPDVLGSIKFIKSCFNPDSGGFSQTPGGKPDVATTASGLMAVAEMKIADDATVNGAIKYLTENAKSFEELRIAVAGLEAVNKTSPAFSRWTSLVREDRNDDGTFGSGAGKARDTGGKAVALLRMGVPLDKKEAVVGFLRSAQNSDGAWSKAEGGAGSDLESTYRIMRAFWMLKEKPDLDRLATFITRCRHTEGGYGVQPGTEATPAGTYFATTVLRWVRLLGGEPAVVETAGFRPLFNGSDLSGWEGDTSLWSARDGVLVGTSKGLKHNDFLATTDSYGSFVLKLTFRLARGEGNSGIQFRSVRVPNHEMSGFQADVGENFWGCLYDESRRNRVLVPAAPAALKALHADAWNQYTIDAKGDDMRLALNGVNSVTYHEADPAIAHEGKFAVQMHAGGPMTVEFKDIYIQALPEPKADSENSPGFHLRALKSPEGERKYSLYIPRGYDGNKAFPVVLFLHGAGERGSDGAKCAQVGLGPAILADPERFQAIAVFPQARKTWQADSDDAKAALSTLDDVMNTLKVDRSKVVLTGLSMGGAGSWSIASANPTRFAAVVPICGRGRTETAKALAALPVWTIIGDGDRDESVLNTRAMVESIAASGGKPKHTEYRGVGHNSWDRAYNDSKIIDWMLAQARQ